MNVCDTCGEGKYTDGENNCSLDCPNKCVNCISDE